MNSANANGNFHREAPAGMVTRLPTASNGRVATRLKEIAAAASTGIDAGTGPASDFLNQFNEVTMLLDMAAEDVGMLDELAGWVPRGYVEHFEASNFRDSALVLKAYALCPPETRERFDALSADLGRVIGNGLETVRAQTKDSSALEASTQALAADVRGRIDMLSSIIHPAEAAASRADITAMFAARR